MSHPKIAATDHDVLDVIRDRWSPRAFDASRAVTRDAQMQLFEAARWAPSSANEQPWMFIVADRFDNPEAFNALLDTLNEGNRTWAQHAPLLVATFARTQSERFASVNRHAWYDTGQALALLSVQATSMGLGIRQMAGFNAEKAHAACEVAAPFEPVVISAIGYPGLPEVIPNEQHRATETQPRSRRPIADFVRWMGVVALAIVALRCAPATEAALPSTSMAAAPATTASSAPQKIPTDGFKVVNTYPHDPKAFTQGLIYRDGVLYESTGLTNQSTLRKVELATGRVLQQTKLDDKYFAEGLTEFNGRLLQLTWKDGLGFVYDRATLAFRESFKYYGEGWGLTHDGVRLILSDGEASSGLRFLDPVSFVETGHVVVKDQGQPVGELNELEFVRGEVYANIWQTDRIARINPATGEVVGWIDLTGLLSPADHAGADVLNGIAYDAATNRLFVTGKLWPKLFEIQLAPKG
jgi:glutamine cyclotransferase/nitroreductase